MLTTILKFEGSDGTSFVGAVESDSIKDFQKMQKHIVNALLKLGDDSVAGVLPIATDAKSKPPFSSVISMETVGSGNDSGFYAKNSSEYRFDHKQNYDAEIDFCKNLLANVKDEHGKKK